MLFSLFLLPPEPKSGILYIIKESNGKSLEILSIFLLTLQIYKEKPLHWQWSITKNFSL